MSVHTSPITWFQLTALSELTTIDQINDNPNYRQIEEMSPLNAPSTQKWPNFVSVPKSWAMFWNLWENNFPIFAYFSFWDMIRFVFKMPGKLWKQKAKNSQFFCPKRYAMFWNKCKINFQIFSIFSFWSMVDFVLKIFSELGTSTTASSTLFANLIQKCYPVTKVIQTKTVQCPVGTVGSQAPHEGGI